MSTEEDFSKLPLEERLVHKVWKVRSGAYEEVSNIFAKSFDESDPCFAPYLQHPSIFKKVVGDSNVVAQENGITTLNSFLQYAGPAACLKVRSHIMTPLIEKGLSSTRAGTKSKTIEALHLLIELDNPTPVMEELTPYLKHRLPKLVAGTANAISELYKNFGARTIDSKLILPFLPKLFAHADKKVRTEATNIVIELYKWMGQGIEALLFNDLKPIQQKELSTAFEKLGDVRPQQTRLLRSQQAQLDKLQKTQNDGNEEEDTDVKMEDGPEESNDLDPYDLIPPTDVLAKIPATLSDNLKSAKWKERKEALEEIHPFFKDLKFKQEDYTEFMKMMAKCMKDVNLQVVQLAAEITEGLAKGLRFEFAKYLHIIFVPTLERTKEKKAQVLDPLLSLLDTMVNYSSLSDVLEDTMVTLSKTRIPKAKEEGYKFLTRCLCSTKTIPTQPEIELIMEQAVKASADSQAPVRSAVQEAIGTLMKVAGERALIKHMEKIDDIRQKKIKEFCEKAEVKPIKPVAPPPKKPSTKLIHGSKPSTTRKNLSGRVSGSHLNSTSSTTQNPSSPRQTLKRNSASIPSKREASSPLKRNDMKASRGLTSMVINKSNGSSSLMNKLENVAIDNNFNALNPEELKELEDLRKEKELWLKQRRDMQTALENSNQEKKALQAETESFKLRYKQALDESTTMSLKLKSKDTQLSRLVVDLEKSQHSMYELQEKYDLLQQQQSIKSSSRLSMGSPQLSSAAKFSTPNTNSVSNRHSINVNPLRNSGSGVSSFGAPISAYSKRYSMPNTLKRDFSPTTKNFSSNDINTGVGKLTIEEKENPGYGSNKVDSEEWKRANEVTINLKARIEKMKHRSRNI